jgi:hypothetical protein
LSSLIGGQATEICSMSNEVTPRREDPSGGALSRL